MKIVSLLPSATELAGELGVAEMLCAISHECDTPPSVLHLPRATGSIIPGGLSQGEINARVAEARAAGEALYTVDGVLIDALSPDLILTQGLCDVCAVTPDTIEASLRGVQCSLPRGTRILSFEGESLEGVRADFFALAELVGMEAAAEAAWARRKAQWDAVAPERSSRRVLLLEWVDPPYSPGHWVPEQIAAAGFVSAIGAPGSHSRPLSMREIRESRPDAIGVISCGFGLEANVRFASELAGRLAAEIGFAGEVAAFDANRCFSRPTFAIVDGADVLYRTFHLGEDVPGMSKRLPGVAGSA